MIERLRTSLLTNPPTVGEAAVAVVIALLAWAGASAGSLPVPGYVVWPVLVLAGVLAIGGIGRLTQRFTWPTDWLDAETLRTISQGDDG